jgi:hypothetical protein
VNFQGAQSIGRCQAGKMSGNWADGNVGCIRTVVYDSIDITYISCDLCYLIETFLCNVM